MPGQRRAAREVIERRLQIAAGRRRRLREHLVPALEAHEREHFLQRERLQHRHLARHRRDERRGLPARRARRREIAGIHRRRRLELQVVAVIHRRIEPVAPVALTYFSSSAAAMLLVLTAAL